MIQFFVFCLLWQAVSGSEYYCEKGDAKDDAYWKNVVDWMNDPDSTEKIYKFEASLTHTELKRLCNGGDIVIVRRFKVDIASKKTTRFLSYLAGDQVDQFEKEGGLCHTKYEEGKDIKEVEYSGRGDLSGEQVLEYCGYRQVKCGDNQFKFSRSEFDVWCRFSLKDREWSSFYTAFPVFKVYAEDLFCELDQKDEKGKKSADDKVLCLMDDCSKAVETDIDSVCDQQRKKRKRMYTYTRTASQWGREAFKHFFRNYILTFIFYCYFMLQARRSPMVRFEVTRAWKEFKKAIEVKEDEEGAMEHLTKKREKFLYERYKREMKTVKKVPVEHLHEELSEIKAEISRQATLVKEEEEGESASNRPPNMSTGTRLVQKEPCSLSELRSLIQWSWMIESHMMRAMKEDDQVSQLRKSYGIDAQEALAKLG